MYRIWGTSYLNIAIPVCKHDIYDQRIYNRMFQQVVHNGGESATNYIKIFQNDKTFEISVENRYNKDQLMHTFLENLYQCGK